MAADEHPFCTVIRLPDDSTTSVSCTASEPLSRLVDRATLGTAYASARFRLSSAGTPFPSSMSVAAAGIGPSSELVLVPEEEEEEADSRALADGEVEVEASIDGERTTVRGKCPVRYSRLTAADGLRLFGGENVSPLWTSGGLVRRATVRVGDFKLADAKEWYLRSAVAVERREDEEAERQRKAQAEAHYLPQTGADAADDDQEMRGEAAEKLSRWRRDLLVSKSSRAAKDMRDHALERWYKWYETQAKDEKSRKMQREEKKTKMGKVLRYLLHRGVFTRYEARRAKAKKDLELLQTEKAHAAAQGLRTDAHDQAIADAAHRQAVLEHQISLEKIPFEQKEELVGIKYVDLFGQEEIDQAVAQEEEDDGRARKGPRKAKKGEEEDRQESKSNKVMDFVLESAQEHKEKEATEDDVVTKKIRQLATSRVEQMRRAKVLRAQKVILQKAAERLKIASEIRKQQLQNQSQSIMREAKQLPVGSAALERLQRQITRVEEKVKDEDRSLKIETAKWSTATTQVDREIGEIDKQAQKLQGKITRERTRRKRVQQGLEDIDEGEKKKGKKGTRERSGSRSVPRHEDIQEALEGLDEDMEGEEEEGEEESEED
eukprot:Hpha_TRINITY_DN16038_c6_g1::TRINITY_DN16038_c6_g1_i1::g.117416::m.117416